VPWTGATAGCGFSAGLDEDVIVRNTSKGLAVSVGLVWNFCFYKFFVYAV
jgi:hypothetical protein